MFAGEEAEPLAFRIRPRKGEAFDSWMDRLTARHEVTRAVLFRHLGCDPRLASCDLARGADALEPADHLAFRRLVERLAWSVNTSEEMIEGSFVSAPQAALLPPAMRVFACPVCWQRSLAASEPLIVARDWILRASWMCTRHKVPLVALRGRVDARSVGTATRLLDAQAVAARRLWRRRPPLPAMLAFNARLIAGPLGEREQGLRRGELGYQTRFAANRFHLSPTRIALLLSAHGDRSGPAERFERFVALSASALIAFEDGLLAPKARRDPPRSHVMPRGQTTVWAHRWEADLADLIEAYRRVMTKMAQRGIQNQAREGRLSRGRSNLAPGRP